MDIQVSSNFERALFLALDGEGAVVAALMDDLRRDGRFSIPQGALEALRAAYASGRASEDETRATIAATARATGVVLCPHSAVGVKVAAEHLGANPMVTLATAHPAKFPDAVEAATGARPPLPARLADLFDRPERAASLPNESAALKTFIRERIPA